MLHTDMPHPASAHSLSEKSFFGGALAMHFPTDRDFADVSSYRPVPDNQEVLLCDDTREFVVIELLEKLENANAEEMALAHAAIALSDLFTCKILKSSTNEDIHCLDSKFRVAKHAEVLFSIEENETREVSSQGVAVESPETTMYIFVYRCEEHSTDLVVSFYTPRADFQKQRYYEYLEIAKSLRFKNYSLFCVE